MSTLYELTGQFKELLEFIEQGEMDEEMLRSTLEGIDCEIELKADGYAKIIKELEGNILTIETEVKRLGVKKSVLETNIDRMKKNLTNAMTESGKTKFKTDLFNFSIQNNQPKLIISGKVPKKYLIKQEPKVNNSEIKELLKSGEKLCFAHLETSRSLRIR